jgi:hypothetical protein
MENKFFMHRIKRTGGTIDKGIEVKETFDAAKQSFHAYLGAYAYGQNPDTDFVSCHITDLLSGGMVLMEETWLKQTDAADAE